MGQSGVKQTNNNHFEITYEAPWGGVATDLYESDIQPNQFAASTGLTLRNGNLCSEIYSPLYGSLNWSSLVNYPIAAVVTINNTVCVLDNYGHAFTNSTGVGAFTLDQTYTSGNVNISCIKIINGFAYIFDYLNGKSYIYQPGVSYTLNNSFVGGKYCAVIDGYLLTANTNQPTDNPAIKTGRVNWSAPYTFGTWDPSLDRRAGYNVLADIEDEITGIFAIANVGFVLRTNGKTQLTPVGVAIQPFDFPTQSSGDFGIGCSYPDTLAVFGNYAAYGDSSGFYFDSGGAPEEICGSAREAIYADINATVAYNTGIIINSTVSAIFYNSSINNVTPELCYTICISQTTDPGVNFGLVLVFWTLNVKKRTWVRNIFDLGSYLRTSYGNTITVTNITISKLIHLKYPKNNTSSVTGRAFTYPIYVFSANVNGGTSFSGITNTVLNLLQCLSGSDNNNLYAPTNVLSFNVVFKREEIKLRRQPTVNYVVIKACGYGTIHVSLGGSAFTDINLSTTPNFPSPWATYISSGVSTGEAPQLSLYSNNFYGTINKVMISGTYADGDLG